MDGIRKFSSQEIILYGRGKSKEGEKVLGVKKSTRQK